MKLRVESPEVWANRRDAPSIIAGAVTAKIIAVPRRGVWSERRYPVVQPVSAKFDFCDSDETVSLRSELKSDPDIDRETELTVHTDIPLTVFSRTSDPERIQIIG